MLLTSVTKLDPSPSTQKTAQNTKLMASCRQFTGQFLDMMLQEMQKTVPDDPLLGDDSHEQQIFQGMINDNVAQEMAKSGGGQQLAEGMYKQLAASQAGKALLGHAGLPSAAENAADEAKNMIPLLKLPGIGTDNEDHDDN